MIDDPIHLPAQPAVPDPVAGKTVAEILGEIVWLMTQDQSARKMSIEDIDKIIFPAIMGKRFHINYAIMPKAGDKNNLMPVSAKIFGPDMEVALELKLKSLSASAGEN